MLSEAVNRHIELFRSMGFIDFCIKNAIMGAEAYTYAQTEG